MSNYSTASENSASDASPTPLPVPLPSPNEAYVLVPATWGGPAWTNIDPAAPVDNWEEGCTTRWDTPTPESWSPVIPPEPLVAPLDTPISPAPLPSPLLLPAPPPTQASPSPAPSPIPQYVKALANQILEAMEDGSDKENVPPRAATPHPDTPHLLQSEFVLVYDRLGLTPDLRVKVHRVLGILLDPKAASRVLYEVISKESAVLMDLLETFHNIAYTPPMGDEVSCFRINLLVDLALRLLQNGVELVLIAPTSPAPSSPPQDTDPPSLTVPPRSSGSALSHRTTSFNVVLNYKPNWNRRPTPSPPSSPLHSKNYQSWNGLKNATLTTPSNDSDTSPPLPPSSLTHRLLPPPSSPIPPFLDPPFPPLPLKSNESVTSVVADATRRPESPLHPPPLRAPAAK
ncbi:hypothetical protein M378DRAFT_17353 [Amanita muscaria Koide BX008]|uniref:Uncharacterized protein n=1 Tax=Amanita muscaria (strain Koide BX008) TaxID=946122 RepID=A0A0C2SQ49_AMAMK|nr:hypothetical protein M378DRAFT_17353 [Amanita muscaria Koide BX008]